MGSQQLTHMGGDGSGVRGVAHFPSAAAAQRYVEDPGPSANGYSSRLYAVPGIPGAHGRDVSQGGTLCCRNVAFAVGQYTFSLGMPLSGDDHSKARLFAALKDWYAAVKDG